MVEKAPKFRMTFKSSPGVNVLGNIAPYLNTDMTNPRELYAMLSQSRHQGALLTSAKVNSQAGAKLPPTDTSLAFRSLKKQPQNSSYPDLTSFRSEKGDRSERVPLRRSSSLQDKGDRSDRVSLRRSSSLQDISSLDLNLSGTSTRKLKPILRGSNPTNEHNEKAAVKFGVKEVHLITDSSLPPIEGSENLHGGKASLSFSSEDRQEEKATLTWNPSPRHHRHHGADFSPDIFPRGQPVEVKKPVTPTYEDYPEVYWELRSPTVHDPSDLKEDMIDRDRYRLKQISSLQLKAMNRELAISKLDSYRKWQQQIASNSPTVGLLSKQHSVRSSAAQSMNGPSSSTRAGKLLRRTAAIQHGSLTVAATSISPAVNPVIKKRIESSKTGGPENATNFNATLLHQYITEYKLRRRQKIEAAARGESELHETEAKPVKATVVNLCIDPDRSSNSPTSDVYTGIKRIIFDPSPLSGKARAYSSPRAQEQNSQENVPKSQGSVSTASSSASLGSFHSYRLPCGVPSAPTNSLTDGSRSRDVMDMDPSVANKKILKKFYRLQVFSEKHLARESTPTEPWDMVSAKPPEKVSYLPQNRPPTYKLDLRNYPMRHHSSQNRGGIGGEEMRIIAERGDGFSLLTSEGGVIPVLGDHSPTKSETSCFSFRFGNGEVIVSRQGKKPKLL